MILTNTLFILKKLLANTRQFHSSRIKRGYDGPGKTTVSFETETNSFLINKCLPIGFQLSDESIVVGPLAIFPQTIFSWDIVNAKDINEATLSLFTVLYPTLDVLVLGLETECKYQDIIEMKKILQKYHIKNEILPVHHACGIYNHLITEGRFVAAGLIPPLIGHSNFIQKLSITKGRQKAD